MPDDIPTRATITELSRTGGGLTHLSEPAVRRHIREARLTENKHGKYSTHAVLNAILKHQARDNRNGGGGGGSDAHQKIAETKGALDCQIKAEQLKKIRFEAAALEGEMVSRAEVNATMASMCSTFRNSLENFVQLVQAEVEDAWFVEWAEHVRDQVIDEARVMGGGEE